MNAFKTRKHTIEVIINENKVSIYYEDYQGEIFIHRINGLCNVEDIFKQDFISECYQAIDLYKIDQKEYKEEMKSDESRFN